MKYVILLAISIYSAGYAMEKNGDAEDACRQAKKFISDVHYNNIDRVNSFLEKDPKFINHRTREGKTCLYFAISLEMAQLLVKAGCDINSRSCECETTLFRRMSEFLEDRELSKIRENIADFLLEQGADVNCVNINGYTILHQQCLNILKFLEKGHFGQQWEKVLACNLIYTQKLMDRGAIIIDYKSLLKSIKSTLSVVENTKGDWCWQVYMKEEVVSRTKDLHRLSEMICATLPITEKMVYDEQWKQKNKFYHDLACLAFNENKTKLSPAILSVRCPQLLKIQSPL